MVNESDGWRQVFRRGWPLRDALGFLPTLQDIPVPYPVPVSFVARVRIFFHSSYRFLAGG